MCDEKLTAKNVAIRDATEAKLAAPIAANDNPLVRYAPNFPLRH